MVAERLPIGTVDRPRKHREDLDVEAESAQLVTPVVGDLSMPHGGIQTQLMTKRSTSPSRAVWVWSSITSVSGQAAEVSVMSMVSELSSSRCSP